MDYTHTSTEMLLEALIGADATEARYEGHLRPLFEANQDRAGDDLVPLLVARELVRRWLAEEIRGQEVFASPDAVKQFLQLAFAGQSYESFVVLYLDAQHRLIEAEEPFRGTLTQTAVYPREIVKRALYWNAAAVLLAHNHPSGAAEPSRADEHLTQTLKAALSLLDVRVLDHFVIAGSAVVSFAERGLL
jgi:DNA repair protein RadC